MHLTLKKEATRPACANFLKQQERFDRFVDVRNQERPHQVLDMKYPAELYVSSSRTDRGLSDLEYPFHNLTITVTNCGRICIGRRKINLSTVFAGQNVGVKQIAPKVWLVSFMQYDLGFFDDETDRVTSAENPFGANVVPMCPRVCRGVCRRVSTLPFMAAPKAEDDHWSVEQKAGVLADASGVSGDQLTAYLEAQGAKFADFERCRVALQDARHGSTSAARRILQLGRELARKEKASLRLRLS